MSRPMLFLYWTYAGPMHRLQQHQLPDILPGGKWMPRLPFQLCQMLWRKHQQLQLLSFLRHLFLDPQDLHLFGHKIHESWCLLHLRSEMSHLRNHVLQLFQLCPW